MGLPALNERVLSSSWSTLDRVSQFSFVPIAFALAIDSSFSVAAVRIQSLWVY